MIKSASYPNYKIETIGISGKKNTKKKVFAELLQNQLETRGVSRPIIKTGFADAVYQTLISLFSPKLNWDHLVNKENPVPGLFIPDVFKKTFGEVATGRSLLQLFGELCRNICPTVWTDRVFLHRFHNYIYIIFDVRFPDEAKAILDHKGILIRLEGGDPDNHITETSLDDYKGFNIIVNCKDRNEMKSDIEKIVANLQI